MIRISKLIKELQAFEKKHGNVPVLTKEEGFGGYGMNFSDGISKTPDELYPEHIEDVYENDPKIKAIFPDWDGDPETLCNSNPIKCVVVKSGDNIYTT